MNKLTFTVIIILAAFANLLGQKHTDNSRDEVLRGSGRVNSTTLAMEFSLPLGNYPGRGINVPISLSYSSKVWRADFVTTQPRVNNPGDCISISVPMFAGDSAAGWTTSMATPYIEYVGWDNLFNSQGYPLSPECESTTSPPSNYPYHLIKRIVVHLPSGETHELRVDDSYTSYYSYESQPSKNGTYYAVDSSNLKYIEDSSNSTYKLLMPDGSYYSFKTSTETYNLKGVRKGETFTDRNGNYTSYNSSTNTWTDTLGRTLAAPLALTAPSSATTQTYTIPGLGGGANVVTYQFQWKKLKDTSAGTSGLTDFDQDLKYTADRPSPNPTATPRPGGYLFGSDYSDWVHSSGSSTFNPIVLTEILLPTGQSYKFSYNIYGEIDRIIYPTGGVETFTYGNVASVSILTGVNAQFNRGVAERKVYESASDTTPYEWTYSSASGVTRITNPDGTRNEKFMHLSSDGPTYGMDNVLAGMGYKELGFNSDNQLVSQRLTHWTKSTGERHPRVDHEESIVYDSSGNGVSAVTKFEYEGDLSYKDTPVLTNKTLSYAFVTKSDGGSYSPGGTPSASPTPVPTSTPSTLLRTTETTYLISDSAYSSVKSNYTAQNMIGLVTASTVKNGAGTVVARSETVYDESGKSPGYRGNPTTAKAWDSTKGAYTSSGNYISTTAKFDSYGNQYEATDARGCTTETEFDGTYHAFPIEVTSCTPSDGTYGSNAAFVTTATFDTTTGLPLTTTDANGLKTEITYDAVTLRPRYVKYYNGSTQVGPTNETIYHDESGNYWVKSKNQIDDIHYAESITYFDGLGRAWKSEEVNSGGNIFVEKEFDADGRVLRVTNPFRAGDTKHWTTNIYDEASRIKEVELQDGSKIKTDYGVSISGVVGVTKQITDQAGKKRKGITDALGNMIRVIEDPSGTPLNTDYVFDTLGNLRKTTQGDQNRFFMHDSLGRLLYAKQVEQDTNSNLNATDPVTGNTAWSVKYEYDDNSNIVKTTDARNQYVEGAYDAFNRIKVRNYSDAGTPDVSFYYDGIYKDASDTTQTATGAVKGKTTGIKSSVSTTNFPTLDVFGRPTAHQQITDGNTYSTSYVYGLSGALLEETYPSGRVVRNTFDENGDLESVKSKKNSNFGFFDYAKNFTYDSTGSMTRMQLGNGHWENFEYNDRQQIKKIGLGLTGSGNDLLELGYEYETTGNDDNNGNLLKQTIKVPGATDFVQTMTYDALNRLTATEEKQSTTTTWKQEFSYDRYGNRNFVTGSGHTTTLGSCSTAACNPAFPTGSTNRNRFASGQGYSFDANGNVTQDAAGQRFNYDAENHQKEFFSSSNSGSTPDATYSYDGEGRRVKKVSSTETTIFVYDASSKVVAEYSTALATVQQVSYLTQDHLGSQRIVTNENGTATDRKDFASFGEEATASRSSGIGYTSAEEPRKNYTGYEKDSESGLEFAQARFYNPTHGRYTSVDPLAASASIKNPQTFNRYSYVLNSPYKFVDPLGLLSQTTGACAQWCPGTGPQVDGSAISGEDASFSWIPELVRGLTAMSEGADKKPVALSSEDQKSLRRSLQPLVFGTIVTKQGLIYAPRGRTIGRKLLTGISRSGFNVTIIVNHRGVFNTGPVKSDLTANLNGYITNATSDTSVLWDPNARVELEERRGKGRIVSAPASSTVVLAHELIHAYNWTRPGRVSPMEMGPHIFQEGSIRYMEEWKTSEFRAVGLGYNRLGDITENDIRAQLGLPRRAAYTSRENWIVCGGSANIC